MKLLKLQAQTTLSATYSIGYEVIFYFY